MFRKIKIAALSAVLALGGLAALPASAQANGVYFSFGQGTAQVGAHFGKRGPAYHRHHRGPSYSRPHRGRHHAACTPQRAVQKARHMGLRNARVVHAGRNVIRVAGSRYRHHRASIVFSRAPNCPVVRAL